MKEGDAVARLVGLGRLAGVMAGDAKAANRVDSAAVQHREMEGAGSHFVIFLSIVKPFP